MNMLEKLKSLMPPAPNLKDVDGLDGRNEMNVKDQYIKNIRFGIRSIDTNLDLKRFIVKQNDKMCNQSD